MADKANQQWRLAARPEGLIKETDFKWDEEGIPTLGESEVLVRVVYLSLDPTNRGWMNTGEGYLPGVGIGDVMRGIAIGVVEESNNPKFNVGDIVQGMLGWQRYLITNGKGLSKLPHVPDVPLSAHFGLFGHIGLSAYFGLLEIGQPKEGETLVVSGAAGAVGSLAGQIGKIKGCRVVGIAGTDEKCSWLTDDLGFDAAINYKTEDVAKALKKHCPDGVDVFFDNVGGQILDIVLSQIKLRARIVLCGMISRYNNSKLEPGPYSLPLLISRRARMEGFIVLDYLNRAQEAVIALAGWYAEGKIRYRVDVVDGLENAPTAVNKLFDGSNKGKLMVKVSEEP